MPIFGPGLQGVLLLAHGARSVPGCVQGRLKGSSRDGDARKMSVCCARVATSHWHEVRGLSCVQKKSAVVASCVAVGLVLSGSWADAGACFMMRVRGAA